MSRTSRTFAPLFMRVSYPAYIRAWFGTEFVQLNLRYKKDMKKIELISSAQLTALSVGLLLAVFCTIGMSFTPADEGDIVEPNDSTVLASRPGPRRAHASGGKCGSDTKSNDYGRGIAYTKGGGKVIVEDAKQTAETSVIDKYGYKSGTDNEVNPTAATYSGTVNGNYSYVQWKCNETNATSGTVNAHKRTLKWTATPSDGYKFDGWSTTESGDIDPSIPNPYTYTMTMAAGTYNSKTGYGDTDNGRLTTRLYAHFSKKVVATVTMPQTEHGSFTYSCVDGNGKVNTTTPGSVITAEEITFVATAASGYKFFGWYTLDGTAEEYLSLSATYKKAFSANTTIYAKFIPTNAATFVLKGTSQYYTDLGAAISAAAIATGNAKVIVPTSNGTVSAGNYTIPIGVTLLLPYDDAYTVKTTDPSHPLAAPGTPSVYRKLTLASGVHITVQNGAAISVSAISQANQPYGGCVYGKYGQVDMNTGSSITLNNGANLYCWGYITGAGEITAQSGSKVYEDFQIACWRGGTAGSSSKFSNNKVFPLAQYYIQNIEAKLHLQSGASEYVWTAVSANSDSQRPSSAIQLIGKTAGLFQITSGTLTKWYNYTNDRQMYELEGDMSIASMSMTFASIVTINSANYVLPLTNNMDITIKSGTMSCNQKVAILPGAKVTINKGANVSFGSSSELYVYDKDEWPANGASAFNYNQVSFKAVNYVATLGKAPTYRTYANMNDAILIVNGTFTTASGHFYTTNSKADICGTESGGKIVFTKAPQSNTTTYQCTQSGTSVSAVSIPITPAQLHNASQWYTAPYTGDNACEYLATAGSAANTTITYANGHWGWIGIWKDYDGTILKVANTCLESQLAANAPADPTRDPDSDCGTTYTFSGWTASRDATLQEIIYTAEYSSDSPKYTVTWKNADGTVLETDADVPCGSLSSYDAVVPTKAADAQYTYTFDGWATEKDGAKVYEIGATPNVSADVTYFATFTPTLRQYNVTFNLQGHGASIAKQTLDYGSLVTKPADPTDADYSFGGWYKEAECTNEWNFSTDYVQGTTELFAKWTMDGVGPKLDIVGWSSNSLTLNLNGIPAAGWPYVINGVTYDKTDRAADRTLTIKYTANADDKYLITVKDKDNIIYSLHTYTIPHVYDETAELAKTNSPARVIVVNSGTLKVTGNVTIDAIYVRPEAELIVNSGVTLNVNKLVLRTTPWQAASLTNNGTITATNTYYTRIIADNSKYFQFAIPLECDVKNVRLSNNSKCTYNTSWMLKSYNEKSRANNGAVNSETSSNWDLLTPDGEGHATIMPSVGYEMFSNTPYYREYYFPVALPKTETTEVGVSYHSGEAGPNHAGWNSLCSPLMGRYSQPQSDPSERLKISELQQDGSYQQIAPDIIYPAVPFYYQASDNGKIYFTNKAMYFNAPRREWNTYIPTQWMQLAIRNLKGDKLDETSIYAHPEKFAPEYETGYDVAKQSLTGGKALIYSELPCGKLAFASVPDSLAEQRIPLTIYAATQEEYVFSLAENNYLGRLQHVLLHDMQNGFVTDLLERDYATEIKAGTNAGRFYIQCVFAAEAPAVTTGVNSIESNDDAPQKIMYKNKVYIIYQGRVYDMTGRQCELR